MLIAITLNNARFQVRKTKKQCTGWVKNGTIYCTLYNFTKY